jgi:hypothetical protein
MLKVEQRPQLLSAPVQRDKDDPAFLKSIRSLASHFLLSMDFPAFRAPEDFLKSLSDSETSVQDAMLLTRITRLFCTAKMADFII